MKKKTMEIAAGVGLVVALALTGAAMAQDQTRDDQTRKDRPQQRNDPSRQDNPQQRNDPSRQDEASQNRPARHERRPAGPARPECQPRRGDHGNVSRVFGGTEKM